MLSIFQQIGSGIHKILHPPQHVHLSVTSKDAYNCLRKLEKKASLPVGDLSIRDDDPMEVAGWPTGHKGLRYIIDSKTSDEWKDDGSRQGYIAGSAIKDKNSGTFIGSLHISKNCPGIFRDSICTTCGHVY